MPNSILRRRLSQLLVCLLVLAPLVSVCLPSPTRAESTVEIRYLAKGTRYETPLYIIRGPDPGPVFMVTGGVHGNETAGWRAAWTFVDRDIRAGTFIVIPEANRPAVAARKRTCPVLGFDLNRQFPQSANTDPTRPIALEIWNVFKEFNVDWYLDLHEAADFYKNPKTSSVGQTLIHYPRTVNTELGRLAVREINQGISVNLHKFTLISYPVPGSIARATGAYLGVNSAIFETSQRLALSTRIGYQIQMVEIYLRELGMAGAGGPPTSVPPGDDPPAWDDDDDWGADFPDLGPGLNLVTLLEEHPDQTTLFAYDSGVEGPVVMVVGGLRGNEPGGVAAAGLVRQFAVTSGTLLVLPEANPQAIAAASHTAPGEADLNRAFPRTTANRPEGALATVIWQVVRRYQVNHLVTFVEGADYYLARTGECGQTVIYYPVPGASVLADGMALDLNLGYDRNLAAFSVLLNPVPTSLARAAGELLGIRAFLIELSAREPLDGRAVDGARAVDSLLARLGMRERVYLPPPPPDLGPGMTRQVLLAGTPLATPLYIQDSGQPGPTVMIAGGLRGDAPATVLAALATRDLRVDKGRLLVLPGANRLALDLGQRAFPGGEDLNRLFPREPGRPADELAGAIWGAMQDQAVQYVLTFTEDPDYYLRKTGHFGHTLIHAGPSGVAGLAAGMAADLNSVILAEVARFTTLRNPAPGSLARAAGDFLGAQAILMDLCSREPVETRVDLALRAADSLLVQLGMKPKSSGPSPRETHTLLPGTSQATPLHVYNGSQPGPTVLVVGGLRGDEPGGVEAARLIADCEVSKGRLLVLPEANRPALAAGTRSAPGGSDLNRAFPRAAGETPSTALARAIWDLARAADVVVSFVEGNDYYLARTGEFGQTLIYFPVTKAEPLAGAMVVAANQIIEKSLPRFTTLRNPVPTSLARAAGEVAGIPAFLVELCRKESLAGRAEQGARAVDGLLVALGMAAPAYPAPPPPSLPPGVTVEWLAAGTKDATPLYRLDSGKPGPVLMLAGGIRGDEKWSPTAVGSLLEAAQLPAKGVILLLPQANRLAVELGSRTAPGEGDLNRAFPQAKGETPSEALATAIWQSLGRHKVTHLITFIEGADYYKAGKGEFGQTVIYHANTGTAQLANAMVTDLNGWASKPLAGWTALRPPVRGSLARAAGEFLGVHAFLVEVSAKEALAERVNWALRAADSLGRHAGLR
ncbi:MAG: succinylglutamate desuccinylase/aspartoacylase family protein [bacterium]|nr:succinylglutamate desuccinylase/aspartoacylase family protein [bacterium]